MDFTLGSPLPLGHPKLIRQQATPSWPPQTGLPRTDFSDLLARHPSAALGGAGGIAPPTPKKVLFDTQGGVDDLDIETLTLEDLADIVSDTLELLDKVLGRIDLALSGRKPLLIITGANTKKRRREECESMLQEESTQLPTWGPSAGGAAAADEARKKQTSPSLD